MKKLITLLLASTCLSPVAPARAEPVSTAIGLTALIAEVGVSTAVAGAIGGAIISTGIAVGSTLIARALQPKPGEQNQTEKGTQTQASIGADVPRNRVYGKQAIAGRLGYWNLFGPDNVFLQLRFDLAAGPHAFFGMFANGKRCTLGATLAGWGQAITDFDFVGVNTAWVNFYAGFYDQATDANLIANAMPAGRYDANNRGRGCCYAIVTLGYKPEVYPQGVPQFQFEIGALLYDPRKDGSTGGSGAHRWTDQHTWEWSDNPALGLYEYERGLAIGAHRVIGRGLAPIDILRGSFVDVANICDETVVNNDASTEKRYRIGMNVGADRELKSVEADFCTAFAGALVEQAGAYGPIAGVAQDVVATFTDADLIQGKPVRYSDKRPRDQLVNALFGAYSEPAQNYQAVPYAPRTSSADESADGDRFAARRDYVQILSQTQAQRVGEIDRREGRYQGTGSVTLGFKYSYLESGDWVRWISARRGFDKLFRVTQHRLAADQSITLALDETAAAVFDFDPALDELDPLAPGDLPGIGTLIGTVPDLEAEALQLVDAATGLKTPAIRALWSPIVDRTVDRVRLQYRLASQPDAVHDSDPFPPDDGEGIIASGIQAGGAYEIRGTIDTTPVRLTTWTAWVPVTAAAEHIIPTSQTTLLVVEEALSHELDAKVRQVQQLSDYIDHLREDLNALSTAANSHFATLREQNGQALVSLGSRYQDSLSAIDAAAKVEVLGTIYSSATEAFAAYDIHVSATFSTPSSVGGQITAAAQLDVLGTTYANPEAAFAAYDTHVSATYSTPSSVGGQISTAANLTVRGTAYANPQAAFAGYDAEVFATSGSGTASGKLRFIAASTVSGAVASFAVEVNVAPSGSPNWQPSGFYLDAMSGFSRIRLVANLIELDHPSINGGVPQQLFSVASVDGANRAVFNTDVYMQKLVADAIQAKHIQSGELTKGGAGSVPSSVSGNNSLQTVGTFTVNLPETINGHAMPVFVGGTVTAQAGSGSFDIAVAINVNGVLAASTIIRTFGAGTYGPVSLPGYLQVIGTGSAMNLVIDMVQLCASGYGVLAGSTFGLSCIPKV